MKLNFRNVVWLIAVVAGFILFSTRPLLPIEYARAVTPIVFVLVLVAFLLTLAYNKIKFGLFFPGPPHAHGGNGDRKR
jgi:hypothetical protein